MHWILRYRREQQTFGKAQGETSSLNEKVHSKHEEREVMTSECSTRRRSKSIWVSIWVRINHGQITSYKQTIDVVAFCIYMHLHALLHLRACTNKPVVLRCSDVTSAWLRWTPHPSFTMKAHERACARRFHSRVLNLKQNICTILRYGVAKEVLANTCYANGGRDHVVTVSAATCELRLGY